MLIFRIPVTVLTKRPWIVCGQTARGNHAAARYLNTESRALARRYGSHGGFVLALRLVNPTTYDHRYVEVAADFGEAEFLARS